MKLAIGGVVQGVGFRPFVYRLATELHLSGWVSNSAQGVALEVEGSRDALEQFLLRIEAEKPDHCFIQSLRRVWLDGVGYIGFEIRESETRGDRTTLVLPDIATCGDCRREIFDPHNRRYHYPFTNCTHCGPRFSIIESLPYDRANTSMKSFKMCPDCQAEYDDPHNRRFHAQANACPSCGPQTELWRASGGIIAKTSEALFAAAAAIRNGRIVGVKGIGGFHLMTDARNDEAVRNLRERKGREEKPFALMFPSLASVKRVCKVSALEDRLLCSAAAPMILLDKRSYEECLLADSIAPGNPCLGVMLPYSPLHHLLLTELGFPVVATSGNLSDEPICTDEHEALIRLRGIADVFLVHDRPIVRQVDDSIVRVMLGRELILRRSRGYAPLPISLQHLASHGAHSVLAAGSFLKNTVALSVGRQVFLSQHIGDLRTEQSETAVHRTVADFENLFGAKPSTVAADLHPDYGSARFVKARGSVHEVPVQHHIAHVLSCMGDNDLEPPLLGVAWDGTGYGLDGTIWGGEFFLVTQTSVERKAQFRPFRLPGGDKAVREPRRTALGLLYEILGEGLFDRRDLAPVDAFSDRELAGLQTMLARGLNSPVCCSVGRLFDGVASLLNLRQRIHFEGQAAMELEFATQGVETNEVYPLPLREHGSQTQVDWSQMIEAIIEDVKNGVPTRMISAVFHNTLVEAIVAVAEHLGETRLALSGGCFQNRYLTERTVNRLRQEGFNPHWHWRVPPNDGGIALGQVIAALRQKG